jgi:hypothetical protein
MEEHGKKSEKVSHLQKSENTRTRPRLVVAKWLYYGHLGCEMPEKSHLKRRYVGGSGDRAFPWDFEMNPFQGNGYEAVCQQKIPIHWTQKKSEGSFCY